MTIGEVLDEGQSINGAALGLFQNNVQLGLPGAELEPSLKQVHVGVTRAAMRLDHSHRVRVEQARQSDQTRMNTGQAGLELTRALDFELVEVSRVEQVSRDDVVAFGLLVRRGDARVMPYAARHGVRDQIEKPVIGLRLGRERAELAHGGQVRRLVVMLMMLRHRSRFLAFGFLFQLLLTFILVKLNLSLILGLLVEIGSLRNFEAFLISKKNFNK